jgi:hypothetical protein
MRTARLNDLNVEKYLKYVLDHIQTKPMSELVPYHSDVFEALKNI